MNRHLLLLAATIALAVLFSQPASAALTSYSQDFESLDPLSSSALGDDGYLVGANIFDPGGNFLSNYFAFPAPNGTGAFSNVTVGPGNAPEGNQGLVVFSDYNNSGEHTAGNLVNALVFREQTISAGDVGKKVVFSFIAAPGDLAPPTTAQAFLKTIDSTSFAETSLSTFDTTSLPAGNTDAMLMLDIDAGLVGNILQFGFESTATNFNPSGVNYDNVNLQVVPEPGAMVLMAISAFAFVARRRR